MITKPNEKAKRPRLSPSLEDYLEAIYWLAREHGVARVSHIAERIKVNKSSVTGALKLLAAKGYVEYDPYQFIQLSPSGEQLAKNIVRRHAVLKRFFVEILGVDEVLAGETACKMEHNLDPRILKKLLEFVESSTSTSPPITENDVT